MPKNQTYTSNSGKKYPIKRAPVNQLVKALGVQIRKDLKVKGKGRVVSKNKPPRKRRPLLMTLQRSLIYDAYQSTVFDPLKGICRGIGNTSDMTALADFYIDTEIPVVAGSYAAVLIIPSLATTTTNYGLIIALPIAVGALTSASNTDLSNVTAWPVFTQSTSPVADSIMTARRSRACEIEITPTGSLTTSGGLVQAAYISGLSTGPFTRVAGGSPTWQGPLTYGGFVNYPYKQTFGGRDELIFHWVANNEELVCEDIDDINTTATTSVQDSAIMILLQAPTSSSVSYHINARYIIEYAPTDTTRPIVLKEVPVCAYESSVDTNKLLKEAFVPLMFSERAQWELAMHGSIPKTSFVSENRGLSSNNKGYRQGGGRGLASYA